MDRDNRNDLLGRYEWRLRGLTHVLVRNHQYLWPESLLSRSMVVTLIWVLLAQRVYVGKLVGSVATEQPKVGP